MMADLLRPKQVDIYIYYKKELFFWRIVTLSINKNKSIFENSVLGSFPRILLVGKPMLNNITFL